MCVCWFVHLRYVKRWIHAKYLLPNQCGEILTKQSKILKFGYFAALKDNSKVRICRMADMHCLDQIRTQINSIAPPDDDATGFENIANKSTIGMKCDCLPGCHETVC